MHLIFGKPVVFLAFDRQLNYKTDGDLLDFLLLKIQKRVYDSFHLKFQFALIELNTFPEMKHYLQIKPNKLGVHFFIRFFG